MRPFTPFEEANIKYLVNNNIKFTQVQITATGLKKSILDATTPMRVYFKENNVHDYEQQGQGELEKVIVDTFIYTEFEVVKTKTSLYRPVTKQGDPRLWIYKLTGYTQADDIHAIVAKNPHELAVINLTRIDIQKVCESYLETPLKYLIHDMNICSRIVAEELLAQLMEYQGMWIKTDLTADTAIGRKIESLLGIEMNSSRQPDYKGIELKSSRDKKNRKTLFCKVPDWKISHLKSSAELVEKYGYFSGGVKSYRNTLSCKAPNSQNLRLNVNFPEDLLEIEEDALRTGDYQKVADVAVWRLQTLHETLLKKHRETFWITVDNMIEDGAELFRLKLIEHTKNPIVSQFDIMLEQSMITVDLLLGRSKFNPLTGKSSGGDTVSFKIRKGTEDFLFPQKEEYLF